MRIRISQQSVETVLRCLGLCLDLKRVIVCLAYIAEQRNGLEWGKRRYVWRAVGKTPQRVVGYRTARGRTVGVEVITGHQDVRATGTRVACGQHKVADQLALDVHVPLLDSAQPEVCRLGIERARKCAECGRRRKSLKSAGETKAGGLLSEHFGAVRGRKGATRGAEGIGFPKERRILPQTRSALTPGRVMEQCVTA